MAGISVQMGVSGIGQFKSAMNQAQQSVKTLDAQLKLNEKQFKASGDSQTYLANKANLLKSQMAAQQTVIKNAEQALKTMASQGVDQASQAYQRMSQQLANAKGAMLDMQGDLDGIGNEAQSAASKTDAMGDSLNSLNSKVDLSIILSGIERITQGMEGAARKVGEIATQIWDTMTGAATWADDELTLASIYGIDVETLQEMQNAAKIIDTPVDAIIKAQQKLANNMKYGSQDVQDAFAELGVKTTEMQRFTRGGVNYAVQGYRDLEDVFWDVGEALMGMTDEVNRDAMAQKIFGRSWMELNPLFKEGKDAYEAAKTTQEVVAEENVNLLGKLDDAVQKLESQFTTLKMNALAKLAPAFTVLADSFTGMLEKFNKYLESDEGKEKMQGLADSVTALFESVTDVDFSSAIDKVGSAIDSLKGGLEWLKDNWGAVAVGIKGIGVAFGALKVSETVLRFLLMAKALNFGGAGAAAAGGSGAAAAAGGAAAGAGAGWLSRLVTSTGAKVAGGAGVFLATLFENAFKPQGNDDVLTEKEMAEYEQTHALELLAQRAKLASNKAKDMADKALGGLFEGEGGEGNGGLLQIALQEMFGMARGAASEKGRWGYALGESLKSWWGQWDQDFELPVKPVPDVAGLQEQLNSAGISVRVNVIPNYWGDGSVWDGEGGAGGGFGGWTKMLFANGLAYVPFNGYPAILHKGERVLTAGENRSYTTNSNLYVERMIMNNGQDADALASAIAARNSRIRAGYGG